MRCIFKDIAAPRKKTFEICIPGAAEAIVTPWAGFKSSVGSEAPRVADSKISPAAKALPWAGLNKLCRGEVPAGAGSESQVGALDSPGHTPGPGIPFFFPKG